MTNDIISVIVPNYNNEEYIEECLDSILSQTYSALEIVIIDDASTDSSIEILKRYEELHPNIKVIYNQINQGVTKNRDIAIQQSSGKYITTLDSDDFYTDQQKLEKEIALIKTFEEKGKTNIIAFSNIVLVNKNGKRLYPNAKNNIREGDIFVNIFARDCMVPRDFIFTKEQYYVVGGFDLDIPIYEDWDLKLRLAKQNEFYYTGLDGIAYRRHSEGLSAANGSKHIKWLKHIYKKNAKLIEKSDEKYIANSLNTFMKKAFDMSLKRKIKDKIKSLIGRK